MKELETLLNSLIQRGWKPWGKLVNTILYIHSKSMLVCLNSINEPKRQIRQDSLRELVSLESGLWQFVCRHLLIGQNKNDRSKNSDIGEDGYLTGDQYYQALNYQFRLLESALVPEEELGKFLVDNIKLEGTD